MIETLRIVFGVLNILIAFCMVVTFPRFERIEEHIVVLCFALIALGSGGLLLA